MKYFSIIRAVAIFLLSSSAVLASSSAYEVQDWEELGEAIDQANDLGYGTIRLKPRSTFEVNSRLPSISSNITINGNGATLEPETNYGDAIIVVDESGNLRIEDLYITGFESKSTGSPTPQDSGLIENSGILSLSRITLSANYRCNNCDRSKGLIFNYGNASLTNVTIFDNSFKDTIAVLNYGSMRILNSTFSENEFWTYWCGAFPIPLCNWSVSRLSIAAYENSITEIGNSILTGHKDQCWSLGEIEDLGGNYLESDVCGLDVGANTIHQEILLGSFGYLGGLVPTVGLEPGSGAIDVGMNDVCSATDARFANRPTAAYLGTEPRCDAGAFEYGGAFGNADLAVNGMNGLWFNRASDGHYVHVWRVSPDRVYVNWTAFDQFGKQMWIYAVANTVGESEFSAIAYFNDGIQLVPGGAFEGFVTANEWGSIEISLDSCTVGTFRYVALDSAFGAGEFQIDRLAFIEGGGCSAE